MVHGEVRVGVVHCPTLNETFHAIRGGGAFCNGAPIRVSEVCYFIQQFFLCFESIGIDHTLMNRKP